MIKVRLLTFFYADSLVSIILPLQARFYPVAGSGWLPVATSRRLDFFIQYLPLQSFPFGVRQNADVIPLSNLDMLFSYLDYRAATVSTQINNFHFFTSFLRCNEMDIFIRSGFYVLATVNE